MKRAVIPEEVSRFIMLAVPTVPHLEAMLLMRRDTSQDWDCRRLAHRLYLNEKPAQAVLTELHATGILELVNQERLLYRYAPRCPDLRQVIDQLASVYAKDLIELTHLIHSRTNKKAQQLAAAFTWRKDL